MNKGIIDLIPAAVEAIKQETLKKMQLFGSVGKAEQKLVQEKNLSKDEVSRIAEMVLVELQKHLK